MEFNLPMAFVDTIPVIIYFIANLKMLKCCYNKMSMAQFSLVSCGTIMLFCGATCKIIWKFLYALKICNYTTLSECFFPMQSFAFFMLAFSLSGMLRNSKKEKNITLYSAVPVVTTHMPFIMVTFLSTIYMTAELIRISLKLNKKAIWFIVLYFAGTVGQAGISSMTNNMAVENAAMFHWIAEGVHILTQTMFLITAIIFEKSGFAEKDCFKKIEECAGNEV